MSGRSWACRSPSTPQSRRSPRYPAATPASAIRSGHLQAESCATSRLPPPRADLALQTRVVTSKKVRRHTDSAEDAVVRGPHRPVERALFVVPDAARAGLLDVDVLNAGVVLVVLHVQGERHAADDLPHPPADAL